MMAQVAQALQGPPGSAVEVQLRRADSGEEEGFTLRRRAIQLSPVKSTVCSGIGGDSEKVYLCDVKTFFLSSGLMKNCLCRWATYVCPPSIRLPPD